MNEKNIYSTELALQMESEIALKNSFQNENDQLKEKLRHCEIMVLDYKGKGELNSSQSSNA